MICVSRFISLLSILGLCLLSALPHKSVAEEVYEDQISFAGFLLSDLCIEDESEDGDCPNCRLHVAIASNDGFPLAHTYVAKTIVPDLRDNQLTQRKRFFAQRQRAPPFHV